MVGRLKRASKGVLERLKGRGVEDEGFEGGLNGFKGLKGGV